MAGFPRDRDTVCPAWCEQPAYHVASTDYQDQRHLRTVARIEMPEIDDIRLGGGKPVTVRLEAWADWDWKQWPAVITVSLSGASDVDERDLASGEARALADPLQQAAGLIEDSQS